MRRAWILTGVVCAACATGPPRPQAIRLGEDACAHCRMTIVSMKTVAQIVTPGGEPVMFDEIGCLRDYLGNHPVTEEAVVYVADHRTGEWIDAARAVFSRTSEQTPMGSGLLAHADIASRDSDPAALHATPVAASIILTRASRSITP